LSELGINKEAECIYRRLRYR